MAPGPRRISLWFAAAALLATASGVRAADFDPAKLAELRSLIAEAMMLDAVQSGGRVTQAYAKGLRDDLQGGLKTLADDPALGPDAKAALSAVAVRDQARLRAIRDRLVARERSHGRAD